MDILFFLLSVIFPFFVLMYSAILHEIAHGFVADRLGDPTARLSGRLTLNPLPHIDLYMTIFLPLLLYILPPHIPIGGAKPVPVDPFNLKEGRKDVALVSLAGPLTNVLLAIIAALLIHSLAFFNIYSPLPDFILRTIAYINIYLAILNLLPLPPLDGSKIFSLLLPEKEAIAYLSLGRFGIFILFILIAFPLGPFSLGTFMSTLFNFSWNLLGL